MQRVRACRWLARVDSKIPPSPPTFDDITVINNSNQCMRMKASDTTVIHRCGCGSAQSPAWCQEGVRMPLCPRSENNPPQKHASTARLGGGTGTSMWIGCRHLVELHTSERERPRQWPACGLPVRARQASDISAAAKPFATAVAAGNHGAWQRQDQAGHWGLAVRDRSGMPHGTVPYR